MFSNLKPYPGYAGSPGRWIPAMPSHWKIARGASVLQPVEEKNSALLEETVLSLSYGRVIVKPADKLRGLVPESFNTYQILEPGDIVVRPTDLQNDQTSLRVGHVKDHGMITSAYLGLRPSGINDAFACSYLAALDHMKIFYGMGSGLRQNLDLGDFKRLSVPVPPADEQAAIVRYLGHAHARIDRAIAAKRKLIALLEEQKQAVIHQAVTRGLDPTVPLKDSGIPWLGEIPAHWQALSASRFIRFLTSGSRGWADFYSDNGSVFLQSGNLGRDTDLNLRVVQRVTLPERAEGTRTSVRKGDVLICITGAKTGNVSVIRIAPSEPTYVNQHIALVRCDPAMVNQEFIGYFLSSPSAQSQFKSSEYGGTKQGLGLSEVRAVAVGLPPLDEQEHIVTSVRSTIERTNSLVAKALAEIELLREFRARLTSDVVTGQVDVREIAATLPELTDDMLANTSDDAVDTESEDVEDFTEGEDD